MANDIIFPNPLHGSRHSPGGPDPIPGIGGGAVASTDITDSTTTGRAVLTAASQAAARTAIGAGTSSFNGTYAGLTGVPTSFAASQASVDTANAARGVEYSCLWTGTTYVRPNYSGPVNFIGPSQPAIRTDGITTGGDAQAVQGLDRFTLQT